MKFVKERNLVLREFGIRFDRWMTGASGGSHRCRKFLCFTCLSVRVVHVVVVNKTSIKKNHEKASKQATKQTTKNNNNNYEDENFENAFKVTY